MKDRIEQTGEPEQLVREPEAAPALGLGSPQSVLALQRSAGNTAVGAMIVTEIMGPMAGGTVKVVDGPHNGITGEVEAAEWGNIADER